jgi:hypothetical protein
MSDFQTFVEAVRECGHEHAPEVVDRLTAPQTFGAAGDVPTATITAQNVNIREGDAQVRIPITISSDNPDQTVEGIVLSVRVENPTDTADFIPIVDADQEAFDGSLWSEHQHLVEDVRRDGYATRFLLIPWSPPFGDIVADGLVCTACVDTSKLKAGREYRVNTAAEGRSSAVAITNPDPMSLSYTPVHLDHRGGTISVVAKQ